MAAGDQHGPSVALPARRSLNLHCLVGDVEPGAPDSQARAALTSPWDLACRLQQTWPAHVLLVTPQCLHYRLETDRQDDQSFS